MDKRVLLAELKEQFEETKKRLGFRAAYEEINAIAYIEDMVLSQKFVSEQFSRQMINRMVDSTYSWLGELYGWAYPAPMDVIHLNESKKLTPEERKEVLEIIDRIMYMVRRNKRIAFTNLTEEGPFVDELVDFWNQHFKPFMATYHKKFEALWKEEYSKDKFSK